MSTSIKFLAAVFVFFFAQHLREEQHRVAVAVGVAIVAAGSPIRPLGRARLTR